MTHEELCERARRWLAGRRRCSPVFSNIASCSEIPDAIGWASAWKWCGSTVVECKTSLADFHADKWKYVHYKHPNFSSFVTVGSRWRGVRELEKAGYVQFPLSAMGNYRFFMCEPSVITADLVEKHRPDHGLLYVDGRKVRVVREAPARTDVDRDGEIRYLRFAIINSKTPYSPAVREEETSLFGNRTQSGEIECQS